MLPISSLFILGKWGQVPLNNTDGFWIIASLFWSHSQVLNYVELKQLSYFL